VLVVEIISEERYFFFGLIYNYEKDTLNYRCFISKIKKYIEISIGVNVLYRQFEF